jgi:hypothetical protein
MSATFHVGERVWVMPIRHRDDGSSEVNPNVRPHAATVLNVNGSGRWTMASVRLAHNDEVRLVNTCWLAPESVYPATSDHRPARRGVSLTEALEASLKAIAARVSR